MRFAIVFGCSVSLVISSPALGQSPGPLSGRVPIEVELVDSTGYLGVTAVIVRDPGRSPHDRIVLARGSASRSRLAAAFFVLSTLHERDAGCPSRAGVIKVPELLHRGRSWTGQDEVAAERIVDRLRMQDGTQESNGRVNTRVWVKRVLTPDYVNAAGGRVQFDSPCPPADVR